MAEQAKNAMLSPFLPISSTLSELVSEVQRAIRCQDRTLVLLYLRCEQ
jgi:hypothetical protein